MESAKDIIESGIIPQDISIEIQTGYFEVSDSCSITILLRLAVTLMINFEIYFLTECLYQIYLYTQFDEWITNRSFKIIKAENTYSESSFICTFD